MDQERFAEEEGERRRGVPERREEVVEETRREQEVDEEQGDSDYIGDEEEILMEFKPARRRFLKEYTAGLIWLIIAVAFLTRDWAFPFESELIKPELLGASFFLSAAFIFFIYSEARRNVEKYKITDTAVYEEVGQFSQRVTDIPFMKLQRCGIHRPFIEKIVGIGDVRVDAGRDYFLLKGIANPEEVERLIEKKMREVMSGGNIGALHQ